MGLGDGCGDVAIRESQLRREAGLPRFARNDGRGKRRTSSPPPFRQTGASVGAPPPGRCRACHTAEAISWRGHHSHKNLLSRQGGRPGSRGEGIKSGQPRPATAHPLPNPPPRGGGSLTALACRPIPGSACWQLSTQGIPSPLTGEGQGEGAARGSFDTVPRERISEHTAMRFSSFRVMCAPATARTAFRSGRRSPGSSTAPRPSPSPSGPGLPPRATGIAAALRPSPARRHGRK